MWGLKRLLICQSTDVCQCSFFKISKWQRHLLVSKRFRCHKRACLSRSLFNFHWRQYNPPTSEFCGQETLTSCKLLKRKRHWQCLPQKLFCKEFAKATAWDTRLFQNVQDSRRNLSQSCNITSYSLSLSLRNAFNFCWKNESRNISILSIFWLTFGLTNTYIKCIEEVLSSLHVDFDVSEYPNCKKTSWISQQCLKWKAALSFWPQRTVGPWS